MDLFVAGLTFNLIFSGANKAMEGTCIWIKLRGKVRSGDGYLFVFYGPVLKREGLEAS